MEMDSDPRKSEPIHMSDTKAKVTDILSDVLGVLTTDTSKEKILFDIEELYLTDERCDPSRPLSSYVTAGKTKLQCDASFLPGNNKWNIRYKATCVWKYEKPPLIKIFGRHISSCSAAVSLFPGRTYEDRVVQVSPPNAALAILVVNNVSFPVLIFLNRLFRNSSLEELQNYEWIQDHLNIGDKVEFVFENIERKSVHKKFHVPATAWKSELKEQRRYADEEQRKHADEQKTEHDSGVNGAKRCRRESQGDDAVSNVATLEGTNSDVTCVGISDVGTCTETSGSTSRTEPPDKHHVGETKDVSTVVAAESASDTSLMKLKECGIYTARERGCTNLSSVKSQQNDRKAAAISFSQHCEMQEASHTKHDEPVADLPDITEQGETRHLPAMEHGVCGSAAISQLDGTHSVHGISEGEYGEVPLYRVLQSVQSDDEDRLYLSGTGIIRNDCAIKTVHPQFSYELLKPPDERGFQFRAALIGFVIFSHTASRLPKRRNSHSPADDMSSNTGVRILPESSNKRRRMSNSLAALGIELEMPLDPLNPTHIAVPRTLPSSHAGMTAYLTGMSCNDFTLPSNDYLQIPVCLYKMPAHNPTSEYKAVTLQGKFPVNLSIVALDSTETVCDRQSHDLDSCIPDTFSQEMASDPSCELHSKLSGHKEVLMQTCERRSSKSVWDTPLIFVPVFLPLSHSSSERMSVSPSTRWTLILGSLATEKHCLMYVPSTALCSAQSDKQHTQSTDQLSEDSFTSNEELSTSESNSSHFGKYTGNIHSFGYDHGTIAFTVDGRAVRASFYRKKVYVNGTRICNRSKLCDVLYIGMPVTLDVRPYEGESFTYKAVAVYVEPNVEEQLDVCDVASEQKDASDVVSVNSDSARLCHKSSQNNAAVPTDQSVTNDETYIAVKCWENFCAENSGVRKHMKDSVSRPCAYEPNVTDGETCKDSTAGTFTSPKNDTDITQSFSTVRQETAVHEHLAEETYSVFSTGVLRSEENTIVPKDDQEKVAESEFDTEIKPPGIVKLSQIICEVTSSDCNTGELFTSKTNTSDVASSVDSLPQSSTQMTVSDNDAGELLTSKTNTSDVASPVDSLPQPSTQITDKMTVSDNDPGELFTCKTNTSDVASPVDSLPQPSTQITDKMTVSDNDPGELFTCKTNTSDVASPVDSLPQSATQITDKITVSDNDPGVLFTSKTNTSDVASPVDSSPQPSTHMTDKMTVLDNDAGELLTSKTNTSDVASPVDSLPRSATQITDKITVSDNDPGELFTYKTNTSDVASPVDSLPQPSTQMTVSDNDAGELLTSKTNTFGVASPVDSLPQPSTQITDKMTVSDNDPGELFTCKTNTSDVASPVDSLPQPSTQITDKMTVSDNDAGELLTSKTNTSDVASSVDSLPQPSTQITDKITVSDNDPGELFTSKTNTSNVASPVDSLPQSATNVPGVIDDVWMSSAVLMTAKLRGAKLRVLIHGKKLYIKRQRCTLTNTSWQQLVQGMQVFADISKLKDHPSGAVYVASSAWKGKRPRSGSPCNITPCGTATCVYCRKKTFDSDVDPSTCGSKVNSDAGRQKSKHCKTDGIIYPTENTGTCREKPMLNDKSCSSQLKIDAAVEEFKQKYLKALRSIKSSLDKKYVGTVERYTVDDGFGLVNFHLENKKARAVFFREHIFAKGVSVADSYVKENITEGRLVTVSAIKPCYREDIPYVVNIDTEYQDTKGEPATLSYSVAAAHGNEEEEVTPTVEDLEFESIKFRVKEREMFYKSRLCYDWEQRSVRDGDGRKDTEATDHPEEARADIHSCSGTTVGNANVTASDNTLEVRDHPNQVKLEKPLCFDKPTHDSYESASLDQKGTEVTYHSDDVKADELLCQEGTVGDGSVTASVDKRNIKVTDVSGEIKTDKPSCQEETVGNAVVTLSTGKQRQMQLPVTSAPHTGLGKKLKKQLARVKRYESSMRGILEYSIFGAVLDIVFDRSVVEFYGQNEITDMREHLRVDSIVHFDGEVVGEDSLLGCFDIVVTRVSQSKTHRKPPNSKLTHSLTLELAFPSLHEGLVTGRTYEGIVTKIQPPRAFVATVTEGGKTYDVFVYNTFFSPAEYGEKLPSNHPVLPYVAEGYKVHLIVERTPLVNSKYTYEWFAVDAWTEAGDISFRGSKHKTSFMSKEMDDHQEVVMDADHRDHPEGGIDADHDVHLEGVIMTLYPEWGVLNADHLNDEVTFFARETFLFGVRLTCVDLRKVFRPGDRLCFTTSLEPSVKKAHQAWLGAHDTPSDADSIASRIVKIYSYCTSHKIEKSVVKILANELGKVRRQLEVSGRIQTSSVEDDDDDDDDDAEEQDNSCKASERRGAIPPDNSECSNYEQADRSDSWSDSDADLIYISDESEESHEISIRESSVDQLKSSETGMSCSSSSVTGIEVTSVHNTADVSSSIAKLERAERLRHKGSLEEDTPNNESEHDAIPITIGATKNNEHIVPVTRTSYQQCTLHARNRISEDSHTCTDGATSLSTEHSKREVSRCPVLHPEMQETLRQLLCEALQKYNIELDILQLIVSEALTAVEEELKGVLRGKLLDRVLNKVAKSASESEMDQKATSRIFETLTLVSKEWKQKLSEFLLVGSAVMGRSMEQDVVEDDRTQLRSGHTRSVHVQVGGLVDKAVQTISTGSVLFLKVLPDS